MYSASGLKLHEIVIPPVKPTKQFRRCPRQYIYLRECEYFSLLVVMHAQPDKIQFPGKTTSLLPVEKSAVAEQRPYSGPPEMHSHH